MDKHVFSANLAPVPIFHAQSKSHRQRQKQNLTQFTYKLRSSLRAVKVVRVLGQNSIVGLPANSLYFYRSCRKQNHHTSCKNCKRTV